MRESRAAAGPILCDQDGLWEWLSLCLSGPPVTPPAQEMGHIPGALL